MPETPHIGIKEIAGYAKISPSFITDAKYLGRKEQGLAEFIAYLNSAESTLDRLVFTNRQLFYFESGNFKDCLEATTTGLRIQSHKCSGLELIARNLKMRFCPEGPVKTRKDKSGKIEFAKIKGQNSSLHITLPQNSEIIAVYCEHPDGVQLKTDKGFFEKIAGRLGIDVLETKLEEAGQNGLPAYVFFDPQTDLCFRMHWTGQSYELASPEEPGKINCKFEPLPGEINRRNVGRYIQEMVGLGRKKQEIRREERQRKERQCAKKKPEINGLEMAEFTEIQ